MGFMDWLFGKSTVERPARSSFTRGGCQPEMNRQSSTAVLDRPETTDPSEPWWKPEGATLTELFEPPRPELSHEARAFENLLISHFDGHNLSLPPLLHAAERVFPLLSRSDYSMGDVAEAVSEDQVIAACVLRLANSPLYRGVDKITSLQLAVGRLGTKALRMMLMHESFRSAIFRKQGAERELARMIWSRSLASACIMRRLAKLTRVDQEDAFLVGLLHDIGNVVVLRIAHEDKTVAQYSEDIDLDTFEYLCYETHQEFGELIANSWSLPAAVKTIICNHHTYPAEDDPQRIMRLMIHVSEMINSLMGYAPFVAYNLLESRAACDLVLADRAAFRSLLDELPEFVDETIAELL